jgi:predicted metal-binding protein
LWFSGYLKVKIAVAFSAPSKATYLFTKVPASAATALLQFGDLYRTSKTGDIPWKQFPEALQSTSVAKIPPVGDDANQEK